MNLPEDLPRLHYVPEQLPVVRFNTLLARSKNVQLFGFQPLSGRDQY